MVAALFSATEFLIEGKVLARIEAKYGLFAKNHVLALVNMLNRVHALDEQGKLEVVNDFFNKTPYVLDKCVWGVSDY